MCLRGLGTPWSLAGRGGGLSSVFSDSSMVQTGCWQLGPYGALWEVDRRSMPEWLGTNGNQTGYNLSHTGHKPPP